jgi:D-sedoheptulose 7-phosphate isomerase
VMQMFEDWVAEHSEVVKNTFDPLMMKILDDVAYQIAHSLKMRGKLMLFGNGGSAADSQHIAAEFVSKLKSDRDPLAAIALTTDTSILTAVGNDYGFNDLFKRQVLALGKKNDIAIGISTSGNSENVIRALKTCSEVGIHTVLLTGNLAPTQLLNFIDHKVCVRSSETAHIQELHIMIGHMLCAKTEELLDVN